MITIILGKKLEGNNERETERETGANTINNLQPQSTKFILLTPEAGFEPLTKRVLYHCAIINVLVRLLIDNFISLECTLWTSMNDLAYYVELLMEQNEYSGKLKQSA